MAGLFGSLVGGQEARLNRQASVLVAGIFTALDNWTRGLFSGIFAAYRRSGQPWTGLDDNLDLKFLRWYCLQKMTFDCHGRIDPEQ
jgi:hypothetical protein